MIDKDKIQTLIDLPIELVATRLGLKVSQHKCLCPFHDDHHASMVFSPRTNRYRCYACGEYGNSIDMTMKLLHKTFPESCDWLASENNIILESYHAPAPQPKPEVHFDAKRYEHLFRKPTLSNTARHFLYDERHLSKFYIDRCRLTSFTDKKGIEWLQIPYYSVEGKLIGVQNRRLTDRSDVVRFRFPKGSQCKFFNLPVLKQLKDGDELWLAEGVTDCLALLSCRHKAIAIPSATLLKMDDLKQVVEYTKDLHLTFHIAPDRDEAGEHLFAQLQAAADALGFTLERHDLPEDCKDYADYHRKNSPVPGRYSKQGGK